MGADITVKVGCYLRIPHTSYLSNTDVYYDVMGKKTENKFDPQTGEPNRKETLSINKTIEPSTWIDKFEGLDWYDEDAFSCPEYAGNKGESIFIPNSKKWSVGDFDYQGEGIVDLSRYNPEIILSKFRQEMKQYIDLYEYHFKHVDVCFGVVSFWY